MTALQAARALAQLPLDHAQRGRKARHFAQPRRPAAHRFRAAVLSDLGLPSLRASGRSSLRSRPRSPSSWRSTPNTRSISTARPPILPPFAATRASSCRRNSTTPRCPASPTRSARSCSAAAAHDRPGRPHRWHHAGRLTLLVAHVRRAKRRPAAWQPVARLTEIGRLICRRPRPALALTPVSRETSAAARSLRRTVCCRGRSAPNLIAPSTHPERSGPATSPIRSSSSTSRRTPRSGSISAPAPAFPGW